MKSSNIFSNKKELLKNIKNMLNDEYYDTTYYYNLYNDGTNAWALVFGWLDGYDDGKNHLNGCLAYLPSNSLMSEFNYDWIMPYDEESGEVDDTCITLDNPTLYDIKWFEKQWKRMIKDYKLNVVA